MNGALTGSETVDAKNFQQLVNSLKELSAAHKELLRSHEELARSHEIATRTSIQYEDRIAMLESSSSQGGNRRRGAAHGALASCTPDAKTQVIYHNPDGLDCSPVVTWGRHVWLSGITCGSVVEPTFAGQMRVVFDNLVRLLVMAGTDVAHLLQVKVHLKDIREMEAVCDVWDKFFSDAGIARERRPSRHITQAALSNAKLQVEMFAEAVLPGEGERAFPSGVPPKRIASA
jgi:enamine deaminase RidA (YjgF/YER057c/UK114 family)